MWHSIYRADVSDRRTFALSSVISIIFAIAYAQVELWLDWRKVLQASETLPDFKGIIAYNWFFTNALFLLVAFSPLIPLLTKGIDKKAIAMGLGNFFLICVLEDAFYFLLQGRWITLDDPTAKVMGSIEIGGILIPVWYFAYLLFALYLYSAAFSDFHAESSGYRYS